MGVVLAMSNIRLHEMVAPAVSKMLRAAADSIDETGTVSVGEIMTRVRGHGNPVWAKLITLAVGDIAR